MSTPRTTGIKMRAFFIAFIALGCNEFKLNSLNQPENGDQPEIAVNPTFIDFGTVRSNDGPVARTFNIESTGFANLNVDAIEIVGNESLNFTIPNNPGSFVLPPGAAETITVVFEPAGPDGLWAQAIVHSDDPDHPQIPVDLIGEGAMPELMINPDPLNFGNTYVGCTKENLVTLTNVGNDTLEIYSVTEMGSPFYITNIDAMPIVLEPAETSLVTMEYTPDEEVSSNGQLTVFSNTLDALEYSVYLGAGEYLDEHVQLWENPVDPPSDILFAVDLSCSMDADAATLANNFSNFINQLSNYSNDWQIMVANEQGGCSNSGLLTPNTSNYTSIFQQAVQCQGSYGCSEQYGGCMSAGYCDTEALLTISSQAVEQTDSGECNDGFMRSNALLHVVLVSDEAEQSSQPWDNYVDQMIAKKGNPDNLRISSIAGDYPGGCSANGAQADAGSGYWEATNATGGIYMSFCSNWASATNLALLAEASVIVNSYPLDYEPVVHTIEVLVNGLPVTGTWHYDSTTNSVIFDMNAPDEGDVIEISYAEIATCD